MAFQRRQDIALDSAHPHTQRHDLHGEGLAGARCAADGKVGVFIDLSVERVNDAKGIIVAVQPQQDAVVIGQLEAGKHIGGCGAAGQHIALGLALQTGIYVEKRHSRFQCRLLLEQAVPYLNIHGFHEIAHLLFAPEQFLIGRRGNRNQNGHVKQILIPAGQPLLDVVACLNRACQLLVVGRCILQLTQLGAVEPDTLCHTVYGFAADLSAKVQIHIHPLAGVDKRRHPAAPHPLRESVFSDVEVCVVHAVHDDIAHMLQVKTTRSNKICCPDLWYRIDADDPFLCRHGVHHNPIEPALEWVIHAGAPVEIHIQDLCHEGVLIPGLHDAVAALGEISACVLGYGLQCSVDFAVVSVRLSPGRFILENQKKAAGQRLPASLLPDEADGAFAQLAACRNAVLFDVRLKAGHILVGVCLAGHRFELQPHGRYLQPAGKCGDDAPLLLIRAEQKIDRLDLQNLDESAVCCLNDAVSDFLERNVVLDELQPLCLFAGACPSVFPAGAFCSCLCHSDILSSCNAAAAAESST